MEMKWKRLLMGGSILAGLVVLAALGYTQTGGDIVGSTGPKFFSKQTSDPVVPVGKAAAYVKDAGGKTELFFKNSNASAQLTENGALKFTESDPLAIHTETDPLSLHAADTDNVKKEHIDWGAGEHQVNADDIPASATKSIPATEDVAAGVEAHGWGNHAEAGYLMTETDPLAIHEETDPLSVHAEVDPLSLHSADTDNIKKEHIDWGTGEHQVNADDVPASETRSVPLTSDTEKGVSAYGWGDHSQSGYLTQETDPLAIHEETDPLSLHSADTDNIKKEHIDWGTGEHQVNVDDLPASETRSVPLTSDTEKGVSAYGWGDHSQSGYLTQETDPLSVHEEVDPTALHSADTANVKASHIDWGTDENQISADDIPSGDVNAIPTYEQTQNWDAAYGWGNHAEAGYLFIGEATEGLYPQSMGGGNWQWAHISADEIADGETKAIPTSDQQTLWDTAYGWGDHASAGYLTSLGTAILDEDFTANGIMQRTAAGTYGTITDGQSGQFLKTNGSGTYSWAAAGANYAGVCTVSKSGSGDYTTIQAALNAVWGTTGADGSCNGRAVGTLSATNKWVVLVYPGDYSETLQGKNFVSLVSAEGSSVTKIIGGTRAINGTGCSVNIEGFTINAGCGGYETGVIELSNCSDSADDVYGIRDNVIIGSSCGNPIVGVRGTHTAGKAYAIERNHFFGPTTSEGYGSAVGVTAAGNWYLDDNTSENWSTFGYNNNGTTIYARNNKVLSGYNGFHVESGGHGFKTYGNAIKATNGFYIHCHNGGIYSCWSTAQATSYGDNLDVTNVYVLSGNSSKQFNRGSFKEPTDITFGTLQSGYDGMDGQLKIYSEQGVTDYTYTINPNAAATQDVTLTLPPDDGNAGEFLQTDGSGALTFAPGSIKAEDIGATCTTGTVRIDTGGDTTEFCYCSATDTWKCAAFATGPAD